MKRNILVAALAAFLPSAGTLLAVPQVPETAAAGQQAIPGGVSAGALSALANDLIIDEPGDGRTWARGPKWKASFGPEGMTYIPFFGSDAPQNYPVRFDLVAAHVAGEPLELLDRTRTRNGSRVSLHRGSLAEVYHLEKDTVEQTFVIEELPGRGAIALEIEVTTELNVSKSQDGGTLFSNDLGSVHYGQAMVLDAVGKTLLIDQQLTSTGLRIVVPEGFVQSAVLPLVVDPILTTFPVRTNSRRQLDIDVSYEASTATYQIVFSELQSIFDADVLAASYSTTLDLLLPAVSLDITSASWNMPRNATCYHEEQFLCVSLVGNVIGSKRVWGRTRHAGSGARGPQFTISGFGAATVDVGGKGNSVLSSYDYMVVWQEVDGINQDMDIVAQAVRGDSTLTFGRILIDGDVGDMDRDPAISKSSGRPNSGNADNEYMIVWEREISPTDHNIRAQVIEYTGSRTGHNQFNAYTFGDSINPEVSTVSREVSHTSEPYWVLVFERLTSGEYDIFAVVARDGDADNARNVINMQNLDTDLHHRDPVIAFDGYDYFICYQTEEANGDRSVHFTSANVLHDGGELRTGLSLRRDPLALSEGDPARISIGSHWDGGGPSNGGINNSAIVAWTARDDFTADTNASAAEIVEIDPAAAGSQYCAAAVNSTGTSAWIRAEGAFWSPGISVGLRCFDMPLNSFGYFLTSTQAGFIPNPGGSQGHLCLQGGLGRFNLGSQIRNSGATGSVYLSTSSSSFPTPNGTVAANSGETWNFQCWFRETGGNSNFSNAVGVTFD